MIENQPQEVERKTDKPSESLKISRENIEKHLAAWMENGLHGAKPEQRSVHRGKQEQMKTFFPLQGNSCNSSWKLSKLKVFPKSLSACFLSALVRQLLALHSHKSPDLKNC